MSRSGSNEHAAAASTTTSTQPLTDTQVGSAAVTDAIAKSNTALAKAARSEIKAQQSAGATSASIAEAVNANGKEMREKRIALGVFDTSIDTAATKEVSIDERIASSLTSRASSLTSRVPSLTSRAHAARTSVTVDARLE